MHINHKSQISPRFLLGPFPRYWLACLACLTILLTACDASSSASENSDGVLSTVQSPTSAAAPATATPKSTPEPTATIEPTATMDSLIPFEMPLEWLEPTYLVIKKYEPDASLTTSTCLTDNYRDFGECVTHVNFCPSSDCTAAMYVYGLEGWLLVDWDNAKDTRSDLISRAGLLVFGDKYFGAFSSGQSVPMPAGLFFTYEEWGTQFCMMGETTWSELLSAGWVERTWTEWAWIAHNGDVSIAPLASWPIPEQVMNDARADLGNPVDGATLVHTVAECQQ